MRRAYRLDPQNGVGSPLEFEWNEEAGTLHGRDAERVRAYAEEAQRLGHVVGHPHPTSYAIRDPVRRRSELAVILGNLWRLSPDLAEAYPAPSMDTPPESAVS